MYMVMYTAQSERTFHLRSGWLFAHQQQSRGDAHPADLLPVVTCKPMMMGLSNVANGDVCVTASHIALVTQAHSQPDD